MAGLTYSQALPIDVSELSEREAAWIIGYATEVFEQRYCKRRDIISSWSALLAYVKLTMANDTRESFRVLFLDKKNQLIKDEVMNRGTVDHAPVYPREVARRCLELDASAVILLHNHPSGDPAPSPADVDMTRQITDALKVFRIAVHDHLVVGRDGVASFKALALTYEQRQEHFIRTDGDGGGDEHPADEAAFYARLAARTVAAAPGEAIALPRQALATLSRAEAHLRSALGEIERAKARICDEHGLEEV